MFTPPKDLEAFLSAGSAPVYIGFGSIVIDDPDRLMTMVLKAVKTLGIRAVISKGWSGFIGDDDQDIFFIGDCPHEWLFQHMAAVVHHGGAGTTACGLRYARPTVIVPFFGECVNLIFVPYITTLSLRLMTNPNPWIQSTILG